MADDIDDYVDENPVAEISSSIEDLDAAIKGAENFRSIYRTKHKELAKLCADQEYKDEFSTEYELRIETIKKYIVSAKENRKLLRNDEDMARVAVDNTKVRKLKFLVSEVKNAMSRLETVFESSLSGKTVEEVTRSKSELEGRKKETQGVLKSIQEIVGAGESETTINAIQQRYEKLLSSQSTYANLVHEKFNAREIDKQKLFKKSLLNIELGKFKGYESERDVYTFQDDFEKLHLRDTPTNLLPDLLKNTYLANPARLLVSDVHEISEIWRRLKEAYGDHQILLTKKLAEIEGASKVKTNNGNPKTVEMLSKIINVMRDLMKLAKRHSIENKLYFGDGLNRIYRQMDGNRRRRWLEKIANSEISEGENQWNELIKFLEKDLKVAQQEAIIMTKATASNSDPNRRERRDPSSFHSSGDVNNAEVQTAVENNKCYICEGDDHVQTNGPGGTKLVQYFACKTFTDWQNKERFQCLKTKKYCVQCLYPGADQMTGKHKDGRCQRDYVCKHPSHERFTVKKHVLVCDEHKDTEENKEILRKYKERCILRSRNLPDHARNIQLVHHVAHQTGINVQRSPNPACVAAAVSVPQDTLGAGFAENLDHNVESSGSETIQVELQNEVIVEAEHSIPSEANAPLSGQVPTFYPAANGSCLPPDETLDESAIYMLQTIKINNELYTIFYDSGCKQFVVEQNAVTRLGSRAFLEQQGPTKLSGVGGIQLETPHGIYRVALPLSDGKDAVLTGVSLDKITETFPMYPLQGQVEEDIRVAFHGDGGNVRKLPYLPASVGGDIAFMFGAQYNRYFPKEIFRLPSGLAIYKSRFKNPDGTDGVVGGIHRVFA